MIELKFNTKDKLLQFILHYCPYGYEVIGLKLNLSLLYYNEPLIRGLANQ